MELECSWPFSQIIQCNVNHASPSIFARRKGRNKEKSFLCLHHGWSFPTKTGGNNKTCLGRRVVERSLKPCTSQLLKNQLGFLNYIGASVAMTWRFAIKPGLTNCLRSGLLIDLDKNSKKPSGLTSRKAKKPCRWPLHSRNAFYLAVNSFLREKTMLLLLFLRPVG